MLPDLPLNRVRCQRNQPLELFSKKAAWACPGGFFVALFMAD
jgi:hypothetical protein